MREKERWVSRDVGRGRGRGDRRLWIRGLGDRLMRGQESRREESGRVGEEELRRKYRRGSRVVDLFLPSRAV